MFTKKIIQIKIILHYHSSKQNIIFIDEQTIKIFNTNINN